MVKGKATPISVNLWEYHCAPKSMERERTPSTLVGLFRTSGTPLIVYSKLWTICPNCVILGEYPNRGLGPSALEKNGRFIHFQPRQMLYSGVCYTVMLAFYISFIPCILWLRSLFPETGILKMSHKCLMRDTMDCQNNFPIDHISRAVVQNRDCVPLEGTLGICEGIFGYHSN